MTKKEEILEKCKQILYSTPVGTPVTNEAYDYLVESVFPLDPKWKEKITGRSIKLIITRRNEYGSVHFSMLMDDDTFENMSIYECINRKGLKDDIQAAAQFSIQGLEVKKNFPSIVRDWTGTIDGGEFEIGKYLISDSLGVRFNNQNVSDNFRAFYMQHE